jgi:hypothetical protein
MPRKALAEPILLLFLGWVLSRFVSWGRIASLAPAGVVGATLLLMFWIIPRSIDLTRIYPEINGLYVFSLFIVGFLLSHYLFLLSGVPRVVYALHFSSMIVALGLLYASLRTLLCSAFTLEDQRAFGWMLVLLGLIFYTLAVVLIPRWLKSSADSGQSIMHPWEGGISVRFRRLGAKSVETPGTSISDQGFWSAVYNEPTGRRPAK